MKKYYIILFVFSLLMGSTPCMAQEYDDSEYLKCVNSDKTKNDNELSVCYKAETARLMKMIKDEYQNLTNENAIAKWNDGDGLKSGNLRKQYSAWLEYRNNYCSMYMVSNINYVGSPNFNREDCILELTKEMYNRLKVIKNNLHSSII